VGIKVLSSPKPFIFKMVTKEELNKRVIVIRTNTLEEWKQTLKFLKSIGCSWLGNNTTSERERTYFNEYSLGKSCISVGYDKIDKLEYAGLDFYIERGCKITDFKELLDDNGELSETKYNIIKVLNKLE
jgi:hypothetical protein